MKSTNSLYIYDNKEELVYQGSGSSEWVEINDVNENFVNAIVSVEDKHFFDHKGFDYLRILKSLYLNFKNGYIRWKYY